MAPRHPTSLPSQGLSFTNSNCPQGGGNTGTAAVSLSATPASINAGETAQITWSATADVCRYDGSSLPAALSNWQTSGYACVGASECQAGANYSATFNTAGNYTLKLTCLSGGQNGQIATQQFKTATVQVGGGGGGGGGGSANCVAPAGLTRQASGQISSSGGQGMKTVNLDSFANVFGWDPYQKVGGTQWPGLSNIDIKVTVKQNEYWSLPFQVGNSYPYYGTWNNDVGPYGTWTTNPTNTTQGVKWTISITPECGDFNQSGGSAPPECYKEYTTSTAQSLIWVVAEQGQQTSPLTRASYVETHPTS